MDPIAFLFMLLESLILYLQPVGDVWDEETHLRMELRAKQLEWERLRLEQEVEQLAMKQSRAVQYLQLSAVAVLMVLLFIVWFMGCKRSLRRGEPEEENVNANEEDDGGDEADDRVQENIRMMLVQHIHWPILGLQAGCEWTTDLMDNYTVYFGHVLADSFYPVLQRAIGVGSAFEGWSPCGQDVVYQVLIPMTPPRGHSFHLELDTEGQRHVRNFCVRVQQECTCTREQQGADMLCFLHHPEEELRRNQDPSLLDTLCTDSYLDVEKTARWFYQLVRAIWPALPQAHNWHLVLLPSRRSCQFKVTNGNESFRIEMLFGVQRDDSDIFVSSQPREANTPSTTWPETYDVAEVKFFKHMARQALLDSLHLRCLQLFSGLLLGLGFSTYAMKTILMHRLNTVPASLLRRRDFPSQLLYISESLFFCLEEKLLNHFIVGNQSLPEEITLPPDVQMAEPPNLFHRLAMDPTAHSQGRDDFLELQFRILRYLRANI